MALNVHVSVQQDLRLIVGQEVLESFSFPFRKPASLQATTVYLPLYWKGNVPPPVDIPAQIPIKVISHDGAPKNSFDIEPGNRARSWETLYALVSSPRPARLRIETEILILNGRSRERVLTLFNEGETPLVLRPPVLPAGFEMVVRQHGNGEFTIAPQTRKSWVIRAQSSAPHGTTIVRIQNPLGETLGAFNLLVPAQGSFTTRTRYVLGVDFGTSGTSIWKRDGSDDRLDAQAIADNNATPGRDDPYRFPSVLYVSFRNGYENGFYIGYEAIRKQKEDAAAGLFVRELKTLLRAENEPFVSEFGPNYRVDLLLKRYLEKLRNQIINPELIGGDSASVAWNFSLPVLDSHRGGESKLFNLQKSRLEKAIRDANYVGKNDVLEFFTEPYCAAIYLLLQRGKYRYPRFDPPQNNDWACIFDSGGGTTDVVLGQLKIEDGQMRFEEVATLGGYLNHDPKNGEVSVSTFGGESLTRTTAIYLSFWENDKGRFYDYLRYEVEELKRNGQLLGLDSEVVYNNLKTVALQAYGNENLLTQPEIQIPGKGHLENYWVRLPDLWEQTEGYKRQLASLGSPGVRAKLEFPALNVGDPPKGVFITRQEFDQIVVDRRLNAIGNEMRQRIFPNENELPSPLEVKWVFGVGGNCRVRRIQDWLQEFFPGGVQDLTIVNGDSLDESDRMLAVAGGAVWASKASSDNMLPYTIRIVDERGASIFEAMAHTPYGAIKPTEQIYDLRFEEQVRFQVLISGKISNQSETTFDGVASSLSITNRESGIYQLEGDTPRRSISLKMTMEGRRLIVQSDESGAFQEIFAYTL